MESLRGTGDGVKHESPQRRAARLAAKERHKAFLKANRLCAIKSPVCTGYATEVDHIISRARSPHLIWDENNWQASCARCNTYKEDHPAEALAKGWSKNSWDAPTLEET